MIFRMSAKDVNDLRSRQKNIGADADYTGIGCK
jgi:hypothetical protein